MSRGGFAEVRAEYEISNFRYQELKNFCLQYYEYKEKISEIECAGNGKATYAQSGKSGSVHSDPVYKKAAEVGVYREYCELIEQTAMAIGGDYGLQKAFLDNVTAELSYEILRAWGTIPNDTGGRPVVSKDLFYKLRRKFFCLLSEKKR